MGIIIALSILSIILFFIGYGHKAMWKETLSHQVKALGNCQIRRAELTKELKDKLGELDAECRVSQMLLRGQEKLTKELEQERENNKTFVDWLERRAHAHDHEYFHNDCSLCSYEKEALKQLKKELHIALPKEEGKNETD